MLDPYSYDSDEHVIKVCYKFRFYNGAHNAPVTQRYSDIP